MNICKKEKINILFLFISFLFSINNALLFPALATMFALVVYYSQMIFVSIARSKDGIKAPKTIGNDHFERVFRVHYNTLKQFPVFLVTLWFFSLTVNPMIGGWLGIAWSLGRVGYMYGYYKAAESRHKYGSGYPI
jgi:glutathione S-transferase